MFTAVLVGDRELIAHLRAMPGAVKTSISRAVMRLGRDLQRHVMQDKLSGQVLHRRTGTLRSSINLKGPIASGSSIYASVGTNVVYAGIHEFGGTITRQRQTRLGARFARKAGDSGGGAGHGAGGAYTIHMPERSFLRSALHDFETRIRQGLGDAVAEGLRNSGIGGGGSAPGAGRGR